MEEPPMLLQRPSSSHSQQTSHILHSTFRDVFLQETISKDTVDNLTITKSGNNTYHDKYVENLEMVQEKWSKKIAAIDRMISHLDKAKEQARLLEKTEEEKANAQYNMYTELGLPSVSSKLDKFIDDELLRENNLMVPKDLLRYEMEETPVNDKPDGTSSPQYTYQTLSSLQMFDKSPVEDNYYPVEKPLLPNNTKVYKKTKKEHTRLSQSLASCSDKNVWRNCMTTKQREEEKRQILKLHAPADFLKNPRFTKNAKQLTKVFGSEILDNSSSCFYPDPCPVVFSDYQVGNNYELKLELQNMSTSSRQVRIIEPTTSFFSLSQGVFPTENGLVAPGMSCFYTVSFSPVSLADYDDVLLVKTQDIEPLLIPLQGRREPPDLTLPRDLDCGYGLVGSYKTVEYIVENRGGIGRFCFARSQNAETICWDDIDYESESGIRFSPFMIQPACFQLNTNETVTIQVSFEPLQVKRFSSKVHLLCDNCRSDEYQITGCGEVARVSLHQVEGGILSPRLEETYDESAERIVMFDEALPSFVYKKQLHVQNSISVPLQFQWQLHFPSVGASTQTTSINEESVFKIEPEEGYLEEQSVSKFDVFFSPDNVDHWFDVASLVLKDIPTATGGMFEKKDLSHLKLSLKGTSQHFSVSAQPNVIIMSGKFYIGVKYHRTVKLCNNSKEGTTFRWNDVIDDHVTVIVDPQRGRIEAGESLDFLLTIVGHKCGNARLMLPCIIPFTEHLQCIHVQCQFSGPIIAFEEKDVSFGLVRLGTSVDRHVILVNDGPVDSTWHISLKENDAADWIQFSVTDGNLSANSKQVIDITFNPQKEVSFVGLLQCHVDSGKCCYLSVYGEVQRPHIYIQEHDVFIDEAYLNIPVQRTITFCNTTLLTTSLRFQECTNDVCQVTVERCCFEIDALEKMEVEVTFVFTRTSEIEALVVFRVEEMIEPIAIDVHADVKGLMVDITVPNMEDIEMQADVIGTNDIIEFGDHVLRGEVGEALVMIENQSAIATTFDLTFKEFPCARVPTPPLGSPLRNNRSTNRSLLMKTVHVSEAKNITEEQARKENIANLLRSRNGLGLLCTPSSGILCAFEKKLVTVSAYSDMWGRYNDTLVCQIGGNMEHHIPVVCDIIGSPLDFQMTKEHLPVLRFGPNPSAGAVVTRHMRINNTSYADIRLDWQTFVVDPHNEDFVDLNCYYGNPFPLLGENGSEVVTEEPSDDDDEERLIRVVLNEHQGTQHPNPFCVNNKQMVIPAQGQASVEVSFTPPSTKSEINYQGYALGYMSLKEEDRKDGQRFIRNDGLDMLPFGLNMTGCVKPSKLYVEACDEEEFSFELSAADLIDAKDISVFKENISSSHRYVIANHTGTTISFVCNVQPPFHLVSADGVKLVNNCFTLKPSKNVEVHVAFILTGALVKSYYTSETVVNLQRKLVLQFENNKVNQSYALTGTINYPVLHVSDYVIDFGKCLVGERRELHLRISNPSYDVVYWNVEEDENCPMASREVFTVNSLHGRIEKSDKHNTRRSTDIRIDFLPKHNVEYECSVVISSYFHKSYLGYTGRKIVLTGSGSYDESTRNKLFN